MGDPINKFLGGGIPEGGAQSLGGGSGALGDKIWVG